MPPEQATGWAQRVLAAHLDRLGGLLAAEPGQDPASSSLSGGDQDALDQEARDALGRPTPLARLVSGFGLSGFERDLLLAAVAADLDPALSAPTVGWALATLPGGSLAALRPDRPLRRGRLVALEDGPLVTARLQVDRRVVLHLHGEDAVDDRLLPYVMSVPPPGDQLPPSRRRAAERLSALWAAGPAAVFVHGPGFVDRRDVVALAAGALHRQLWAAAASDLPTTPVERDAFARLWNREAILTDAVLLLDLGSDVSPKAIDKLTAMLGRLTGALAVSAEIHGRLPGFCATLALPRPDREEQRKLWEAVLPGRNGTRTDLADRLSRRYDLDHADILGGPVEVGAAASNGREARAMAESRGRGVVRSRLDGIAQRIEPRARWEDLVLAPEGMRMLRQLAAAAAGRTLLEDKGFGRETQRNTGITALFAGPSGTGKTLAAEVLAAELGLDLYRIDLATTVSKWIGETEKHLRRTFDAAEQGGVVLLFDEADALFGQRSEVRDSHDRYANLEVSYLLTRMEQYRGIAILTTNLRSAIDPAFLRRLRIVVQFNHPTADERARLWARAMPAGVATEELDGDRLVRLDLTGGQIRIVAGQAVLAALAAGVPVSMAHLRDAVAAEYGKHDRSLAELESWR